MSKSSRTSRSSILLFVFVVSVALVAADLVMVSAQNTNSNTQGDQTRGGQMTSNDNMSGGNTNTGGRRRRRRGGNTATSNASTVSGGDASGTMNATMQGNANMGDQTGNMTNMNTNTSTGGRRRRRRGGNANTTGDMSGATTTTTGDMTGGTSTGGRRRRRRGGGGATAAMTTTTPVADSVQTDLSGTYMGTLSCSGLGGGGEGTLTITGNQYTFAPSGGGPSISGRVVAVTTRGYTAVAMQYGESVAPPPGQPATPPVIVSLRARKNGDNLALTSIANGMKDCGFTSGSGMRSTGRRRRRGRM